MEPKPSNVTGEVVHRHAFEHRINWSHIALAGALIVVAGLVYSRTGSSGGTDSTIPGEEDKTLTRVIEANTNG